MKITYDTIIEYLCSNNQNYSFITKPNIIKFIDSDTNYILNSKFNGFFRMGMLVYNKDDTNISFFTSLLFLMNKDFIYMDDDEKIKNVNKIINEMRNYWNTKFKNNKNFTKTDGEKIILKYQTNKLEEKDISNFLEMICFCFKINIMRLDYKNNKLEIHYFKKFKEGELNIYYPTIILSNYNNFWEPVYNSNNKLFELKNKIFKFATDKYKIKNVNDILQESGIIKKENKSSFLSKDELTPLLQKSKLNKMKKDELINLANSLNIDINVKSTKKIIIENILS